MKHDTKIEHKTKIKLTPKQKQVIKDLQNGYVLITDCEMKGADVCLNMHNQYHINNGVFWNLVEKGLIAQGDSREHFRYGLTKIGMNLTL